MLKFSEELKSEMKSNDQIQGAVERFAEEMGFDGTAGVVVFETDDQTDLIKRCKEILRSVDRNNHGMCEKVVVEMLWGDGFEPGKKVSKDGSISENVAPTVPDEVEEDVEVAAMIYRKEWEEGYEDKAIEKLEVTIIF
jgi:hypothetical protein